MCKLSCCVVTQSFLDLTSLVAPQSSSKGAFDDLAYTVCLLLTPPLLATTVLFALLLSCSPACVPLDTTVPVHECVEHMPPPLSSLQYHDIRRCAGGT
jgi:hypothetical protein